jgi:hypothetical protein
LKFQSKGAVAFWEAYRKLPMEIRQLARKNYRRWLHDPFHPSLHFKKVGGENWSLRIGLHYRALGGFMKDGTFLWQWIGTHAEYDRRA